MKRGGAIGEIIGVTEPRQVPGFVVRMKNGRETIYSILDFSRISKKTYANPR